MFYIYDLCSSQNNPVVCSLLYLRPKEFTCDSLHSNKSQDLNSGNHPLESALLTTKVRVLIESFKQTKIIRHIEEIISICFSYFTQRG